MTAELSLQDSLQTTRAGNTGKLERSLPAREVSGNAMLGNTWYCPGCDRQHCHQLSSDSDSNSESEGSTSSGEGSD